MKPTKSPWSQLGGNAQRTCVGRGCGAKGNVVWKYRAGGAVEGSSAISEDGTVFFCSYDGYLHAVDGKKGTAKWKARVKNPSVVVEMKKKLPIRILQRNDGFSSPTPALCGRDLVVTTSHDGSVYAFDTKTGKKQWQRRLEDFLSLSPAVGPKGMVYVASEYNQLYAIDPGTGRELWQYDLPQKPRNRTFIASQPVVSPDGLVYVGTSHGLICAVRGNAGSLEWQRDTRGYMSALALGDNGLLYAAASKGFVYALDARTGAVVWDVTVPGGMAPTMAIGPGGLVYIATCDTRKATLYALDPGSGAKVWERQLGRCGSTPQPCVASDGTVYIQGKGDWQKRTLHAIDGKTGEIKWSMDITGGSHPGPVVGPDGTVYIGSRGGDIRAIR